MNYSFALLILIVGYLLGALTANLWPSLWRLLLSRRTRAFEHYYPDDFGKGRRRPRD